MKVCYCDESIEIKGTSIWLDEGVKVCRVDMAAGIIQVLEPVVLVWSRMAPIGFTIVPANGRFDRRDLIGEMSDRRPGTQKGGNDENEEGDPGSKKVR